MSADPHHTNNDSASSKHESGVVGHLRRRFLSGWFSSNSNSGDESTQSPLFPVYGDATSGNGTAKQGAKAKSDEQKTAQSIRQMIEDGRSYFRSMGEEDGRRGQSYYDISSTASKVASSICETAKQVLKGKIAGLEELLAYARKRKDIREEEFEDAKNYWKVTNAHRSVNKRYYSILLGTFYLLIAFGIVLADIPLAVDVAEDGFGLAGTSEDAYSIEFLFTNRFTEVIARNWQPLGLALGIALSAFYVKVFYDEFVGWPIARDARQVQSFRDDDLYGFNDQTVDDIRSRAKTRRLIKGGIFIFTLITLVIIGLLRAEVEGANSQYLTVLYPLVTVLLPVIGGVFASIGFSCFQNNAEWRTARKEYQNADAALQKIERQIVSHEQDQGSHKVELETIISPDYREELAVTLKLEYDRGYDRGIQTLPEVHPPTIEHALRIRRKQTSIRLSDAMGREPSSAQPEAHRTRLAGYFPLPKS